MKKKSLLNATTFFPTPGNRTKYIIQNEGELPISSTAQQTSLFVPFPLSGFLASSLPYHAGGFYTRASFTYLPDRRVHALFVRETSLDFCFSKSASP